MIFNLTNLMYFLSTCILVSEKKRENDRKLINILFVNAIKFCRKKANLIHQFYSKEEKVKIIIEISILISFTI